LPLYLAQIQNYNALQIGEVIMWMGMPAVPDPAGAATDEGDLAEMLCALGSACSGASFGSGCSTDFAGPQFNQIQIIRAWPADDHGDHSLIATAYIQPQDAGRRRACSTSCATSAARSASPAGHPAAGCADQGISTTCARRWCRATRSGRAPGTLTTLGQ
jgi:hypothetical protein